MKARTLLDSFNHAFDGIVYAFRSQRNIRIHFLATGVVLILSLFFKLDKLEILILFLAISFVIVAEMVNTAIEAVVDLVTLELHPLAAIAKNVAAGAVLVAATLAVIIGYLIFFPKVDSLIPTVITTLKKTPAYLSLIAFLLTIGVVVVAKAWLKRGRPLQGGMPSGHTALGMVAATAIFFITGNSLVTILAYFLALLIAESRSENKIHSLDEILVGGLVGFLITFLIFKFCIW